MANAQNADTQAAMTPASALAALMEGNQRFRERRPIQRDLMAQIQETTGGQWPFAAVLGCIDSRVPVEVVFDQGLGDVFSARVAGNGLNDDILGSLEYACKVAGSKLIMVLGHEGCGAVKGACDGVELGHITGLLAGIKPAVDSVSEPSDPEQRTSANGAFVSAVVQRQVELTVAGMLERSEVLRELKESGAIDIVGAVYDVGSGAVRLLD